MDDSDDSVDTAVDDQGSEIDSLLTNKTDSALLNMGSNRSQQGRNKGNSWAETMLQMTLLVLGVNT